MGCQSITRSLLTHSHGRITLALQMQPNCGKRCALILISFGFGSGPARFRLRQLECSLSLDPLFFSVRVYLCAYMFIQRARLHYDNSVRFISYFEHSVFSR